MGDQDLRAAWAARVFTLDARSLAFGRVLLGALGLADLGLRARDLAAHYTDGGVLPRAALTMRAWDFSWSLHALWGGAWWQIVLFAVHGALALALLLGWRTRWATLGTWVLTCSLHARNPLLRDAQDDLLRVLLFFGLFLPLGRATSLDARAGRDVGDRSVKSMGTTAWIAQTCLVHWMGAATKLGSHAWRSGAGLLSVWSGDGYLTPVGALLPLAPRGAHLLATSIVVLEVAAPLVVLVPFRSTRWRGAVVGVMVLLHLASAACLDLGILPFLGVASWLTLLPGTFWRRVPFVAAAAAPAPNLRVAWWRVWLRRWHHLIPAAGMGVAVLANVPTLIPQARPFVHDMVGILGMQQSWSLFAPASPPGGPLLAAAGGWLVVTGIRGDGRRLVVHGPGPTPAAQSEAPLPSNHRWRRYLENLAAIWPPGSRRLEMTEKSRDDYLGWVCRTWNGARGDAPIAEVQLGYQQADAAGRRMTRLVVSRHC